MFQKIIYSYTLEPEEIFNIYGDMLIYYLKLRKIEVKGRYHQVIKGLIDDPRYEDLFKVPLLERDLEKIGKEIFNNIYPKYEHLKNKIINFYESNSIISLPQYKDILPIRIDLGNLSPHSYVYKKKYLLL